MYDNGYTPASPAPKRLVRSRDDKVVAGVCAGIGEYFGIDANLVRLLFVLSILLPGPQVIVYLIAWVLMPRA